MSNSKAFQVKLPGYCIVFPQTTEAASIFWKIAKVISREYTCAGGRLLLWKKSVKITKSNVQSRFSFNFQYYLRNM